MRVRYDEEADALYIRLREAEYWEIRYVSPEFRIPPEFLVGQSEGDTFPPLSLAGA